MVHSENTKFKNDLVMQEITTFVNEDLKTAELLSPTKSYHTKQPSVQTPQVRVEKENRS